MIYLGFLMKNVLVIKSSILANSSQSSQLVDYLKSKISANIVEHDFGVNPLPYVANLKPPSNKKHLNYQIN